ncbi:MAG: hypothetical protein U0794_03735 [Isosphaeraceae bacterium]
MAAPTYPRDVAPILQRRCQFCHRAGQVGPFPLTTYQQARKRAGDIATVTEQRLMPPWKPVPGFGPKLKDDHSLTSSEVALLTDWAAQGAPKGEDHHLPVPARFPEGWTLGEPDLVIESSEAYTIPASGPDIYRCFVIPTHLTSDRYISAVEFRPANPRVVHHMTAFLDVSRQGRERDAADPGPGYTQFSGPGVDVSTDLGGWTPGNVPRHLPQGIGRLIPMRSDVILQVHYHPTGRVETDRTQIAFYFSKTPVKQTLHWANASSYDFRLPPGQKNIEVKATWFAPVDVEVLGVTPHMHALGRDFRMTVTLPTGESRDLIHIDNWDPAWQNTYYFASRVVLPKGSTVRVTAHYDNSSHPRNPHKPPKLVRWGHGANDEMCVGYIGIVKIGQDLTRPGEKDDLFDILMRQQARRWARDRSAAR